LFYVAPDRKLIAVTILTDANSTHFEASAPQALFQTSILTFRPSHYLF